MEDNIKIKEGCAFLSINPKLYPIEAVYSAAYVFLDKAYIILDGDPEKEVIVKLKLKKEGDIKEIGNEFFNELINYADFRVRSKETKKITEMLLERALITNDPSVVKDDEFSGLMDELEDADYLDDPENIAVPWEEKYGKKCECKGKEQKDENQTKQ